MVDIGEARMYRLYVAVQICMRVKGWCISGAEVYWHGESDLMKIKETKMRVASYGMICGAEEVYLEDLSC